MYIGINDTSTPANVTTLTQIYYMDAHVPELVTSGIQPAPIIQMQNTSIVPSLDNYDELYNVPMAYNAPHRRFFDRHGFIYNTRAMSSIEDDGLPDHSLVTWDPWEGLNEMIQYNMKRCKHSIAVACVQNIMGTLFDIVHHEILVKRRCMFAMLTHSRTHSIWAELPVDIIKRLFTESELLCATKA
jgi:hypothetical protein